MIRSNSNYTNKAEIRARMQRFATDKWNIDHIELLDPILRLFLESLSEEIYKLCGEVENIQERILNKLLTIFVPTNRVIAQPAHCILKGTPQELYVNITTQNEFRHFNIKQNKIHSFYSVCDTKLYNGNIVYFIHGNQVWNIGNDFSKSSYLFSRKSFDEVNAFWLGIDLDKSIENISGMSFYFDLNGVVDKNKYLNSLLYSTWSIGSDLMSITKGLVSPKGEYNNISLELFSGYDSSAKLNQKTINYYNKHFFTIADDCFVVNKKENFPQELIPYFSESSLNCMSKPLIWIKVNCPQSIETDIIDLIQPAINAFPVLNKELVSKVAEVNQAIPIVPLTTGCNQSFISINKVTDSSGKIYYDFPLYNDDKNNYGIYSLRRGGIEGYNESDAKEYLINTIDLLKHEISSFFKNMDDGRNDFKQIEAEISSLISWLNEKMLETSEHFEIINYLLFTPDKESEIYFIDYWTTNGEEANQIRSGSVFSCSSESVSAYSLSPTVGGQYAPVASDKTELYQEFILNPGSVITDEDIRNFCLKEFEESIREVRVGKGFTRDNNPKIGFVETTDVYLKLRDDMKEYANEDRKEYYLLKLIEASPATFSYRIFIED